MKSAFRRALRGAGWAAVWAALAWTALGAGGLGAARAAEADMEAILRAVDAQSNFEDADFSAVMTIISQDPEKGTEKMVVRQFRRDREEKILQLSHEPKSNGVQGILMVGVSSRTYTFETRH